MKDNNILTGTIGHLSQACTNEKIKEAIELLKKREPTINPEIKFFVNPVIPENEVWVMSGKKLMDIITNSEAAPGKHPQN